MVLRGVLEKSFGSFLCLRGFATLKELADCSEPDDNYQREDDNEHVAELKDFYEDRKNLFFPEIVLAISLQDFDASPEQASWLFGEALNGKGAPRQKLGELTISTFAKEFKYPDGSRLIHTTASIYGLELTSKQRRVYRIDGNHRLKGVEGLDIDIQNRLIPFCLIIFENKEQCRKRSTVFFRNINFKALPIQEEENLRIILEAKQDNGEYVFPKSELLNEDGTAAFGREYYLARLVWEQLRQVKLFDFSDDDGDMEWRTIIFHVLRILLRDKDAFVSGADEVVVRQVVQGLVRLISFVGQDEEYMKCSIPERIACACHFVSARGRSEKFFKWIIDSDLKHIRRVRSEFVSGPMAESIAESFLKIFENTHSKGPYQVFVAMPYVSHKRVNDFNKLFNEVCIELSSEGKKGVQYELIPIMRFRGAAQRIDQRLIECIRRCDLFVADLTGNNPNVIFEVGLAEGAQKQMLLIRQEEMPDTGDIFQEDASAIENAKPVPFDMDKLQWIPYTATGYYNDIKDILRRNLPVMVDQLKIHRANV